MQNISEQIHRKKLWIQSIMLFPSVWNMFKEDILEAGKIL